MDHSTIILKTGREKSLLRKHPWIFSGALKAIPPDLTSGETVDIRTQDGTFIARGSYSAHSQISVRVWTFNPAEPVDETFFFNRLSQSLQRRKSLFDNASNTACRLVNAESDGLPGLVVDRYNDYLVIQCLTAGMELWKTAIVEQLNKLIPNQGIYERSDIDVRGKEGLKPAKGVLSGNEPPLELEIQERGLKFLVDVVHGHKTGFYLDQRENRNLLLSYADQAEVLNCFSYTGGFGIYALAGGAVQVTNVDNSAPALQALEKNQVLNGFEGAPVENVQGDVFNVLRNYRQQGRTFDLIVLDPPKFIHSHDNMQKALRGYKDINFLAFQLLKPGGVMFTFSCSGLLQPDLFQKIVADAALDAGRFAQMIQHLGQASDHPVSLNFPEGSYLKGLICRVD